MAVSLRPALLDKQAQSGYKLSRLLSSFVGDRKMCTRAAPLLNHAVMNRLEGNRDLLGFSPRAG
jgi:hypothetical protein